MNDDPVSTFDVLQFMRSAWKRTAVAGVIGLAIGIANGLLAAKWYKAELSVVPSVAAKSGPLSGAAAILGASDLPFDLAVGGTADVDRIAAIFRSNSVGDLVIAKFGLINRYHVKFLEDAREELWKHCTLKTDKTANLVTLWCEDKVPATAQAMVAHIADEANKVARRTSTSSAGEERRFLEKRVARSKDDLDQASRKLREFQERNKVISLSEQAKAVVNSMATLRAQMLDKELQLAFVDGFAATDESSSSQLRRQVGILEYKLKSLEEAKTPIDPTAPDPARVVKRSAKEGRDTSGIFPAAMNIPSIQYELERLLREQKVQETLLVLLTEKYELALVNEARDTSSFQVLDAPALPTKKSRPQRTVIALTTCIIGCFVGLAMTGVARARAAKARDNATVT